MNSSLCSARLTHNCNETFFFISSWTSLQTGLLIVKTCQVFKNEQKYKDGFTMKKHFCYVKEHNVFDVSSTAFKSFSCEIRSNITTNLFLLNYL